MSCAKVPAPLKCSIQIDNLGKECIESGECAFKYKECVNVPHLSMIDDILALKLGPDKYFIYICLMIDNETITNLRYCERERYKCYTYITILTHPVG